MLNHGNIFNGSLFINIYFYHCKKKENVLSVNMLGINTVLDGENLTQNVTFPVTSSLDYYVSVLWYIFIIEKSTSSGLCCPCNSRKFMLQVCKQIFPF